METTIPLGDLRLLPAWLPLSTPVAVAAVVVLVLWLYRMALPKPLPGIPYNKGIGILGDLPEMMVVKREGNGTRHWFGRMATRHKSALTQFFLKPMAPPVLILTDYREVHDILFRRAREFDRSKRNNTTFGTVIPDHHIAMRSSDPRFKGNKELIKDLMTPAFLIGVCAPLMYKKALYLVDVWSLKAEKAAGRPFEAFKDLHDGAMDIILSVAFGFGDENSPLKLQGDALARGGPLANMPADANAPVTFPKVPLPADVQALLTVSTSLAITFLAPLPTITHWIVKQTSLRKHFARKEKVVWAEIDKSVDRLAATGYSESASTCALDRMVLREIATANKAGRKPVFKTGRMHDEVFGYLVGGHDTTTTTLGWVVKFLSDNQAAQAKLRRQLRAAYGAAVAEGRQPSVAEITKANAPYLDAFLEESLRHTKTLPVALRQAQVDTTILGHHVPKDTMVFCWARGPSFIEPTIPVAEHLRSETSQAAKDRVGCWDDATIGNFTPERWLKPASPTTAAAGGGQDENQPGEFDGIEYDPQAGPILAFGGGPRGCFGKRMAYLELRMVTSLLVWNFEFAPCGPELSSYDGVDLITTYPKQCFVRPKRL